MDSWRGFLLWGGKHGKGGVDQCVSKLLHAVFALGVPFYQRLIWPQLSIVQKLRKPALERESCHRANALLQPPSVGIVLLSRLDSSKEIQEDCSDSWSSVDTVPLSDSLLEKLYRGKAEGSHKSGNRKIKKKPKLRITCTLRVQWNSVFSVFLGHMDHDCNPLRRDHLQEDI